MLENENEIKNAQGLIIYEISKRKFCTDIAKINNILKMKYVELPETFHKSIVSKIIVDDYLYNLINISKLLNLNEESISEKTRLLLYDSDELKLYFLVDQIHHIVIHDTYYKDTEEISEPMIKSKYIKGTVNFENSEVIILDLEKIGTEFISKNILK
jgi:purine-binding chemotaxis protein CheW